MCIDPESYRVQPGSTLRLADLPSDVDGGLDRDDGRDALDELHDRLETLQEMLYARRERALLCVFQAMDTGGKDSTIHSVFEEMSPHGLRVFAFKKPTTIERSHDYLWRVHHRCPPKGHIHVFNRSHYEDVLVVRVKGLVDEAQWRRRYRHINQFEQMLHDEGTIILKFYLHISKDYQRARLQRRLDKPTNHWKFNPADLKERARWDDYMAAYEEAMSTCSTEHAPWYVIPAETRWYRNLLVTRIVVDRLEKLGLSFPEPDFDPSTIVIE